MVANFAKLSNLNRRTKELFMLKTSYVLLTAVLATSAVLPSPTQAQSKSNSATGAVFVMTNNADKNQIIAYKRAADGSLQKAQTFNTAVEAAAGPTIPLPRPGRSPRAATAPYLVRST